MAGTKDGGKAAAASNMRLYGSDYYRRIGSIGGKVRGVRKGFAVISREAHAAASKKGGTVSRRGPSNRVSR